MIKTWENIKDRSITLGQNAFYSCFKKEKGINSILKIFRKYTWTTTTSMTRTTATTDKRLA